MHVSGNTIFQGASIHISTLNVSGNTFSNSAIINSTLNLIRELTIQDFSQWQFLHGKLIIQVIKVYMLAIMPKNYDKEAENSG